ncbi:flagellar motor switch protein FliG [Rhodoblastus acidophilus]|uniref:Flagellar motor switch protein FliG n=1 Tax=Candidatus Rhodoblastus alkanivorans TaxID=2954117 RepID=A0ABS9Z3F4_9HYPH|nr:flagellar motor switch protein FliG [Candidatus Rhodoblastus alkanivorans]MCI4678807.1 flagellar motor switch protein FliG [Candidatus Rhodoblastus alkanivorans]MCI4682196.1 flagellar motor switch protein FliG [Candidatus Rhodoblastus alkanivorans]MDI4639498.1 flagellar motor switch protein FliG [Rhodoblastus acidophilus]
MPTPSSEDSSHLGGQHAARSHAVARPLFGAEKVAALLLALDKPIAGRLLKRLDSLELRQVTRAASELGSVNPVTIERLIADFEEQFSSGAELLGSAGEAENLLAGALPPEEAAEILSDVLGNSNKAMWDRLSAAPEGALASYLVKEHPQTFAFVLSKLSSGAAAKILAQTPREIRNSLMRRMLSPRPVMDPMMRLLERTLHEDLLLNVARNTGADTHSKIAEIINKMEREQIEDVLQSLAEDRPKDAETLRGLLFTFEDIAKLSLKARTTVFDRVPADRVVLALRGTDPTFRELILSSMAARARRMVENELNTGGPAQQREVMKARRAIADTVLEMAERNEIEIHGSGESDALFE